MANSIQLAKYYLPLLQEIYKKGSVTSMMDTPIGMFKESEAAHEVLVPKMTVPGLADYSKGDGYVTGDMTLEWVSKSLAYDRGRKFNVDALDNLESLNQAFGPLLSTFMTTKVIPEVDAARFARYATGAATDNKKSIAVTSSNALTLIDDAIAQMDDAEVATEGRVLFITPAVLKLVKQKVEASRLATGTVIDRTVTMLDGMPIVTVPSGRFYTSITTGADSYTQAVGSYAINFMIVQKNAVMQIKKREKLRQIDPENNNSHDGWSLLYRLYHDAWVMPNKENGIYVCHGTTAKAEASGTGA